MELVEAAKCLFRTAEELRRLQERLTAGFQEQIEDLKVPLNEPSPVWRKRGAVTQVRIARLLLTSI